MNKLVFTFSILACALTGCFGGGSAVQAKAASMRRVFAPEIPSKPAPRDARPVWGTVRLNGFRALAPFDAKTFLYRRGEGEFAADYYNGWIAQPADLIGDLFARYMEASAVFGRTVDARTAAAADVAVQGIVTRLYLDTSGSRPKAVASLRLVFTALPPRTKLLALKEATGVAEYEPGKRGAEAGAFSAALEKAFAALADSIRKAAETDDLNVTGETR
ncbi:MAG: hypothetical protein J5985_09650 [Kiritimatiellae bacterium]|nr:hypothetical protein [Kiritimatiellia bacterium]